MAKRNRIKVVMDEGNFEFHQEVSKGEWVEMKVFGNEWKARQFVTILWENGEVTKGRMGELLRGISNLVAASHA